MIYIQDGRSSFYQWDINQKIVIVNDEVIEIHFANAATREALICEIYEEDGVRVADVPNILLQEPWEITAYATCDLCTREIAKFSVAARAKPSDYIYTETEVKSYEDFDERLTKVETELKTVKNTASTNKTSINAMKQSITRMDNTIKELPTTYSPILTGEKEGSSFTVSDAIADSYLTVKTMTIEWVEVNANDIEVNAEDGIYDVDCDGDEIDGWNVEYDDGSNSFSWWGGPRMSQVNIIDGIPHYQEKVKAPNVEFYIEDEYSSDNYETSDENGELIINIENYYPPLTFYTYDENILFRCNYYRDLNKVIAKLEGGN